MKRSTEDFLNIIKRRKLFDIAEVVTPAVSAMSTRRFPFSSYRSGYGRAFARRGIFKRRLWSRRRLPSSPRMSYGAERKSVVLAIAGPTATIAPSAATTLNQNLSTGFVCVNFTQQGNGVSQRDGNIVKGVQLRVHFTCAVGANAETSDGQVRWMIVLDRSPNLQNFTIQYVLRDLDETSAETTSWNTMVSPHSYGRFSLLKEGTVTLSKISGPTPLRDVNVVLPLKGLITQYAGTANPMTTGYIVANGLYFICFGRMTGAGTLPTITNFNARYVFVDK